jgi:hypothetical protein
MTAEADDIMMIRNDPFKVTCDISCVPKKVV